MKKLIFASSNPNKIREIRELVKDFEIDIIPMEKIGITEDIPETGITLEENAEIKARYIYNRFRLDCFSEDTGLEVLALGNEPGVKTARYAGPERSTDKNIDKLLDELSDISDRRARFRTVICLFLENKQYTFEGIVTGEIAAERSGKGGFGYDPIFIPDGYEESFAVLSPELKNAISHRGRALEKLIEFLKSCK